jgi:glycosyltransferase involved in cell wall biosynthesis
VRLAVRIAHVSDCYLPRVGGIEMHVHDLAERQADAGHDVTILTTTAAGADTPALGWPAVVRPYPRRRGDRPGAIRYRRSLTGRQAARDDAFDVLHVHASAFSPLAFLSAYEAARRGIPTAATLHSLWAKAAPLFWAADRLTGWGDWPVAWSAVSEAAAQPLRRLVAGRAEVAIVPNGIDAQRWAGVGAPSWSVEVRLVSVMRLAARKRPLQLLRVVRDVRRRLPDSVPLRMEIVGDGPERGRLERYLRRHGMRGWVRLHGNLSRSDIRAVYRRSDIFLSAATLESFGIAALEARCAGLPVVARSGTGIQEFVTHGRDGLLLPSDGDMADALVRLAVSPDARLWLRRCCRPTPPGVTWNEVLASCDALYQTASLLQNRPLPAFVRSARPEPVEGFA